MLWNPIRCTLTHWHLGFTFAYNAPSPPLTNSWRVTCGTLGDPHVGFLWELLTCFCFPHCHSTDPHLSPTSTSLSTSTTIPLLNKSSYFSVFAHSVHLECELVCLQPLDIIYAHQLTCYYCCPPQCLHTGRGRVFSIPGTPSFLCFLLSLISDLLHLTLSFHLLPKCWQAVDVTRRRNSMFLQLPSDQSMSWVAMNLLPLLPAAAADLISETGVAENRNSSDLGSRKSGAISWKWLQRKFILVIYFHELSLQWMNAVTRRFERDDFWNLIDTLDMLSLRVW